MSSVFITKWVFVSPAGVMLLADGVGFNELNLTSAYNSAFHKTKALKFALKDKFSIDLVDKYKVAKITITKEVKRK